MKKVLVLTAAIAILAAPAFALIDNTDHDLSARDSASGKGEICVFCHTPHGASLTVTTAPLWNRSNPNLSSVSVYNSATLNANPTAANVAQTDAPLCLSCHDGSVGTSLVNPPNAFTVSDPGTAMDTQAVILDASGLSNDHPIGFSFSEVSGDNEIYTKGVIEGKTGMTGALSFGDGDDFWCSSCHDVHGVPTVTSFLRANNTGSALCLACHNK